MSPHLRSTLVVVGHGMVAHRFVQAAIERGLTETHDVVVIGEEPRPAYDRVALTSYFEVGADALSLLPEGEYDDPRVRLLLGRQVDGVRPRDPDRARRRRTSVLAYDELVLATGAAPFVPPVPGHELPGCFVYRTIEDLDAIRDAAQGARTGAVIGGGLLGLEAANALRGLGLDTHVVEMAPRLMAVQIDDAGGATLARHVEALGLTVHTGAMTEQILGDGHVTGLALRDAEPLDLDLVVFSAGIRPRDALARSAGLALAERGGVLVDERCRTSDPNVWAIGECAAPAGRMYGLVAPGYAMAEVVVDAILGGPGTFDGADMSTKLKLLGVDVASFGDAFATTEGALELVFADAVTGVYKKLVVSEDGTRLLGGVLVGDASAYGVLRPMVSSGHPAAGQPRGADPPDRAAAASRSAAAGRGAGLLVQRRHQAADQGRGRRGRQLRQRLLRHRVHEGRVDLRLVQAGGEVDRRGVLRVGRPHRRPQSLRALPADPAGAVRRGRGARLHVVRRDRGGHGTGRGCDICKPAVASILASLVGGHVLEGSDPDPAGHQRRLPRQPPAQRLLLGRPADPGRRDHAREADRDRRGRPRLRALHQDHRRPADRPVRRPHGGAAGDLAAAGRRRLRVRARLRQGAADGEVVRGLHLVPLRRPGLGAARHRPRAALPRAALAAQAQGRRQRLRPRVRRGAVQGLRGDRHREGVEPLRRRQRRRDAGRTRGCWRATSTPRRWSATSTGSSCTTSAPPTGCSGPRPGWSRSRVASTGSARWWWTTRSASAASWRRPWRGTSRRTPTSGAPPWTTPRSCAGSCPSSTRPRRRTRTSPSETIATSRCRPSSDGPVLLGETHPGGAAAMSARSACSTTSRSRAAWPRWWPVPRSQSSGHTTETSTRSPTTTLLPAPRSWPAASWAPAAPSPWSRPRCTSSPTTCAPGSASTTRRSGCRRTTCGSTDGVVFVRPPQE